MKKKLLMLTSLILVLLLVFGAFSVFSAPAEKGWKKTGNQWYYIKEDGKYQTGWFYENGKLYYLQEDGAMKTGWLYLDGGWYYFDTNGAAHAGWLYYNGVWYLCSKDNGYMLSGFQEADGIRYYLEPGSGAMQTGWKYIDGEWYYFASSGAMQTGWQWINGNWYLLDTSGKMITGWFAGGGNWYYLTESGAMASETQWADGRQEVFHTNGAWINTAYMDILAQGYDSATGFLILTSLQDKVTKVYTGSYGNWQVEKAILCSVGDSANGSGTVTGDFYVGYSSWGNPITRGYSFDDAEGHTLYYWTRFCDAYLFHSILYDGGTYNETPYGNGLGEAISHGCVRMRIENARWINETVPDGTRVIVY